MKGGREPGWQAGSFGPYASPSRPHVGRLCHIWPVKAKEEELSPADKLELTADSVCKKNKKEACERC